MTFTHFIAATSGTRLDPLELFLQADIVVQLVMAGLILASIWVWTIIVSFSLRMGKIERRSNDFEADFWESDDFDALTTGRARKDLPPARVAAAGVNEWKRSVQHPPVDREGTRSRLAGMMESQVAHEADELSSRLGFLATTGSVAPFVGLFGTVWGIMNSFFQIGAQQSASLAVVAPGIAEALLATGIGLVAAIPAVIFYNKLNRDADRITGNYEAFADEFATILSRQLDAA